MHQKASIDASYMINAGYRSAAFLHYNRARIFGVLRRCEQELLLESKEGGSNILPQIDEIDFGKLTDDTEWEVFFNYITRLSPLVAYIVDQNISKTTTPTEFPIHMISCFLTRMSTIFGKYYASTKVLKRGDVKEIQARLYFWKVLLIIYDTAMCLLTFSPLEKM